MRIKSVRNFFFLGFILYFMSSGNAYAKVLESSSHFSENVSSNIHCFIYKTTFDATLLTVETDLEYEGSRISQKNTPYLGNLIQSFDSSFGYKNYLSQKIGAFHYSLHSPVNRYLLNCIFLI